MLWQSCFLALLYSQARAVLINSSRSSRSWELQQRSRFVVFFFGASLLNLQIESMNQNYTEFKFPQIKPHPWSKVFRPKTPPEAIELMCGLLQYTPTSRLKTLEVCIILYLDDAFSPSFIYGHYYYYFVGLCSSIL